MKFDVENISLLVIRTQRRKDMSLHSKPGFCAFYTTFIYGVGKIRIIIFFGEEGKHIHFVPCPSQETNFAIEIGHRAARAFEIYLRSEEAYPHGALVRTLEQEPWVAQALAEGVAQLAPCVPAGNVGFGPGGMPLGQ